MSMREEIINYYEILLNLGWLSTDEDGNVSLIIGNDIFPATIDGKRLIMPTIEQMKNRDWNNRIGFHPLRESYDQGASPVVANLRNQYVQRLNTSTAYLMDQLIKLAHNVDNQKNLTIEQSQVLSALSLCGDATVKTFTSLQEKTRASGANDQFVSIFIRKGGTVRGNAFSRAAIVTFPIYQKLIAGEEKVNGVKISKKDREMFLKLYRFVFDQIDDAEQYNVGVSSRTAPFLEALVLSTIGLVAQLQVVAQPYMSLLTAPTIMTFPEELNVWKDIFKDNDLTQRLASSIPNLVHGAPEEEVEAPRQKAAESVRREESRPAETSSVKPMEEAPRRGPMTFGAPPPGKLAAASGNTSSTSAAAPRNERNEEYEREQRIKRQEEEERLRRERQRRDEEERERRERDRAENERRDREQRERDREEQRRRDEYDREHGRGSSRSRDDRDRDYDDRDRDRDRSRGRTGDIFEDNPALRSNLRSEERSRDYDDRDRDRPRDLRDRGRRDRGRYRDDYDDDYRDDPRDRHRRRR